MYQIFRLYSYNINHSKQKCCPSSILLWHTHICSHTCCCLTSLVCFYDHHALGHVPHRCAYLRKALWNDGVRFFTCPLMYPNQHCQSTEGTLLRKPWILIVKNSHNLNFYSGINKKEKNLQLLTVPGIWDTSTALAELLHQYFHHSDPVNINQATGV